MPYTETQAIAMHGRACEQRDRADWATASVLHERYASEVFQYVLRRVPRREEAEDITAEVFAAAFVALPRFRGECPPYLWLLGIARRQIAAALRRRERRRETLASELAGGSEEDPLLAALSEAEGPEAALVRAEARRVLRELLAGLNADQREALMLQQVERLSAAEIGIVMGKSAPSVYSLLKRARANLYRRGRAYFLGEDEGER
jgi:RNA polymerase sigma-70 factor (ECF subfamily)